jgi:DNA (cytosine-5)-methyltransferase 1
MDAELSHAALNRDWPVIERDIHHVAQELLRTANWKSTGRADWRSFVSRSPSPATGRGAMPALMTRADTRRLSAHPARPQPNVPSRTSSPAYKGKSEGLDRILAGIDQINRETGANYRPVWQVLDAASFGVPQHRERIFIVGSRDGKELQFPRATHGVPDDLLLGVDIEPYRTAWDALGDLPERLNDPTLKLTGKWADLLPSIPEGENYLWHTPRGRGMPLFGWRTRYWSFLLKLAKSRPSWTIQAQPGPATGPFHWTSRRLSIQELCRLQTLPDGLQFDCGRNDAQRMLGNAVPSLLAEVIAREIRGQLLGKLVRDKRPKLLPPARSPIPPAGRVAKVPAAYLSLAGNHAAHPGEGRGSRARVRLAA